MSSNPTTVSGHFMLEPSSDTRGTLDAAGTAGSIAAGTSGTSTLTTGVVNTLILVWTAIASGSVTVSTVADTINTYTRLGAAVNANGVRGELWWAWEPTAQAHTITVTLSASSNAEIVSGSFKFTQSGSTSMPFDPTSLVAVQGNGTIASAGAAISTNVNPADILIGCVACLSNPTLTVGGSFTTVVSGAQSTNVSAGMEYLAVSTSAAQSYFYTLGATNQYVMLGVAIMNTGKNVQVVSAASTQEFVLKNIFSTGKFELAKWDGKVPVHVSTFSSSVSNLNFQVTPTTENMVLINVATATPIEIGYDGVRSI